MLQKYILDIVAKHEKIFLILLQATIQWWWDGGPEIKEGVSPFSMVITITITIIKVIMINIIFTGVDQFRTGGGEGRQVHHLLNPQVQGIIVDF